MKKFAFASLMMVAVICCSIMTFSGCDNTKYTYSEFQLAYQDFVTEYKGEIFDDDGNVKVNYKNADMVSAINKTDVNSKMTKFTRLSADVTSNQAIFEPTLKACFMYVNNYINVTIGIDVPTNESTNLYNSLKDVQAKTQAFVLEKYKLDTRENFDVTGGTEKSWINSLLDRYMDLVNSANEFSKSFITVYEKYNTSASADRAGGRPAIGNIERYYLKTLSSLADVYINICLNDFYNKAELATVDSSTGRTDEMYTYQNYSGDVNKALKSYLNIASQIKTFEAKEGEITDNNEKVAINAYKSALCYTPVFEKGYKMVFDTYKKANGDGTISQGFKKNIEEFYNCEYKNLTLMLQDISTKVLTAV